MRLGAVWFCIIAPLVAGLFTWSVIRSRVAWDRLMQNAQVRAILEEKIRERPGAAPAAWGTVIFGLAVMWLMVVGTGVGLVYAEFIR